MSDLPPDPELRALFEAQRHDEASHAPSFPQMLARAQAEAATAAAPTTRPTPRTRWRREWAGGLAAAAAIAALIVIPRVRSGDDAFEQAVHAFQSNPALGAWQSPTDGLLTLPGDRLLSTVPTMGTETQ